MHISSEDPSYCLRFIITICQIGWPLRGLFLSISYNRWWNNKQFKHIFIDHPSPVLFCSEIHVTLKSTCFTNFQELTREWMWGEAAPTREWMWGESEAGLILEYAHCNKAPRNVKGRHVQESSWWLLTCLLEHTKIVNVITFCPQDRYKSKDIQVMSKIMAFFCFYYIKIKYFSNENLLLHSFT